ncbi:hypothetical protein BDN72DRAFT_894264 [Pluteus cervinus]|uniref:Uncharacterized protein n=1 Tax=Pluteus cervinus TaxID=181527 RepID=A0ACD3B5V0_9AGAR|nr:hypothetical protein BDN72DRAFT_894264 [Pluteus cervinus]
MNLNNANIHLGYGQFYNVINHLHRSESDLANHVLHALYARRAVGANYDSDERKLPPCHPETRLELLDNIIPHWASRAGPQVMWLQGSPGFGKSTISQEVAKRYAAASSLAASFFFSSSSPDRNHTGKFVSTIAYDIAVNLPQVRPVIREALRDESMFEKTIETIWANLVVYPLSQCTTDPLLIIVDGLDECADNHQTAELLKCLLGSIPQLNPGVKILLSCRPEPFIKDIFASSPVCEYELDTSSTDIRIYLERSFEMLFRGEEHVDELIPEMIDTLVENSSGQFLYASTVIDFIASKKQDANPLETLEDIVNQPAGSFKELDNLYLNILERAKQRGAFDPLVHVLFTHRIADVHLRPLHVTTDLTIHDLASFWSVECRRVCMALSGLSLLLSYKEDANGVIDPNEPFWFRHRSFVEFLIGPTSSHPFLITPAHLSHVVSQSIRVMESRTVSYQLLTRTEQTWIDLFALCDTDLGLCTQLALYNLRNSCRSIESKEPLKTFAKGLTKLLVRSPGSERLPQPCHHILKMADNAITAGRTGPFDVSSSIPFPKGHKDDDRDHEKWSPIDYSQSPHLESGDLRLLLEGLDIDRLSERDPSEGTNGIVKESLSLLSDEAEQLEHAEPRALNRFYSAPIYGWGVGSKNGGGTEIMMEGR